MILAASVSIICRLQIQWSCCLSFLMDLGSTNACENGVRFAVTFSFFFSMKYWLDWWEGDTLCKPRPPPVGGHGIGHWISITVLRGQWWWWDGDPIEQCYPPASRYGEHVGRVCEVGVVLILSWICAIHCVLGNVFLFFLLQVTHMALITESQGYFKVWGLWLYVRWSWLCSKVVGACVLRRCKGWRQSVQFWWDTKMPASVVFYDWGGERGEYVKGQGAWLAFIWELRPADIQSKLPWAVAWPTFVHHTQLLRFLVALARCYLLTFVFLVVFVPCFFPHVYILIINVRLELEELWVLFCWDFCSCCCCGCWWLALWIYIWILCFLVKSDNVCPDVLDCKTRLSFPTNSCCSVFVTCKRNVALEVGNGIVCFGLFCLVFFLKALTLGFFGIYKTLEGDC